MVEVKFAELEDDSVDNVVVVYGVDVELTVETIEVVTSGVVVTSTYVMLSAATRAATEEMIATTENFMVD